MAVAKDSLIVIEHSASNPGIDYGDSPTVIKISTVGASHHPCYLFDDWNLACKCVVSFLRATAKSLTSLFFLSGDEDLGPIFRNSPTFPKLRTLELQAVFNARSFSEKEQEWLTKFLQNHSSTLQMLVIKPKALILETVLANPFLSVEWATPICRHLESDTAYTLWLAEPVRLREAFSCFHQLILPELQILEIGLRETVSGAQLLPDLYHIAPTLKKLTITNVRLTTEYLVSILDGLAIHDGKVILEELSYTCDDFSHQIFDILAEKLPKLKKITINCATISECPPTSDGPANLSGSIASQYPSSVKEIRRHLISYLQKTIEQYPFWPIQNLQLSYAGSRYNLHAGEDVI